MDWLLLLIVTCVLNAVIAALDEDVHAFLGWTTATLAAAIVAFVVISEKMKK